MSLFFPSASMTLEAAIVLPLFLFFFMNLLSVVEMMRLHGAMAMALRETGYELAVYGYAYDEWEKESPEDFSDSVKKYPDVMDGIKSTAFSALYIRNRLLDYAGRDYLARSPVKEENRRFFWEAHVMEEDDTIELLLVYKVSPPFSLVGFADTWMYNNYHIKAWTGYDVTGDEGQEMEGVIVYVTDTGEVYHRKRQCTYLKLSIQAVDREALIWMRNREGERYSPCTLCETENGRTVYITEQGERYHGNRECSALKRTVKALPLEEAEKNEYRPCSRCGSRDG